MLNTIETGLKMRCKYFFATLLSKSFPASGKVPYQVCTDLTPIVVSPLVTAWSLTKMLMSARKVES